LRLRIHCSPYHTNSALWPFIHQLEREADFRRGESTAEKLDKLEALLSGSTDHVAEVAPLFAALLSVPAAGRYPPLQMTPLQQKAKTINALLDRLGALAARAPVLFVFEDVHWIDPTSIELLTFGARRIRGIRAFAILTSRTTPDYPWLSLEHVTRIQLERLDRRLSAPIVGK